MLAFNFNPFPDLSTSRLNLRRIRSSDAEALFLLRSDPRTMKYIPRPPARDHQDVLEWIETVDQGIERNETLMWAIELNAAASFLGMIGFVSSKPADQRAEVGYMILPDYYGHGFVTEALRAIIQYGFDEMKLHSIEAVIDPENLASERVLQKCGFKKEAHFRENEYWQGRFLDTVVYSRLASDGDRGPSL
jgi:[ribosomal protein S5]-alanine N-acetyltransferase